jgi:hypothetical protein
VGLEREEEEMVVSSRGSGATRNSFPKYEKSDGFLVFLEDNSFV